MSQDGKRGAAEEKAAERSAAEESAAEYQLTNERAGQVRIRLPNGEHSWVSAEAFNLISEREFRDSERLRRLRGQRNLAAAVAGATVLIVAAGFIGLLTRDRSAASSEAPSPAKGDAAEIAIAADAATPMPAAPRPLPPPSPEALEIEAVVRAWAGAWAERDVDSVMASYSPDFLLPDDMSRATWEALQRERITSPELLAVTLERTAAERTGPESAVARCLLTYDTPGYRAWVHKTLELVLESGRWRIADEVTSLVEIGVGSFDPVGP